MTPWAPLDWRISSCKLTSNIFVFSWSLTLTVSQSVECKTGQSEWTNTIASPSHKSYLWFCTIAKIQLPLNHTLHYHIIAKHNPARRPSHHRHHQSCSLSHRQSALLTINTSFKPFLPTNHPLRKPQPSLSILSKVGSCVSSGPAGVVILTFYILGREETPAITESHSLCICIL